MSRRPQINTIHVINLDKDKERWENLEHSFQAYNIPAKRWPAVYGKDLPYLDKSFLNDYGVGETMILESRKSKKSRNVGEVGCYLSHRNLLEHLSEMNVPDYYGHLILEDDLIVPKDLLDSNGQFSLAAHDIPYNWDIVYLYLGGPVGTKVSDRVLRVEYHGENKGNWSTMAYLVRHGSIKTKILPWLKYMIDSIDNQLKLKFNEWNVYAVMDGDEAYVKENTEATMVSSIDIAND